MKINLFIISLILSIILTTNQSAKELLIYADTIDYDSKKTLIAKGNVKLISGNEIITSSLVIIKEDENIILLPNEFQYKDADQNYYFGSSGEFTTNFENAKIQNIKLLLNDGTRLVGKEAYKTGKIDLINKGVYSPCKSKIKINNFICPIWQIEGEQILHDRENLFIHQKHSKIRLFNIPVFYFPYLVAPSPLRKERKSGFLNPTINFNFLDTQMSQSISFPYYFAISRDKELLLTPTINYGGGVDASQRITYEYDQLISGGNLSIDISTDTNFENQNNENWLRDASLILNLNKNINTHYKMFLASALQTSPTYLRRTDQNNILNRNNTLSTTFDLNGYDLREKNDKINFNISGYQVVKNSEDNKTSPTTLPYVSYVTGNKKIQNTEYTNHFTFYNIFRDIATDDHAQQQQKFHYSLKTNNEFYSFYSKFNFKTELHTQYYNIENKKISGTDYNGTYGRIFPMSGLYIDTPLINKNNNLAINPKASFIINGSQPSSNKISNEESTNNSYTLFNNSDLNRYTGTDKLDNSKRVNYGIDLYKNLFKFELFQSYELNPNSNYNKDVGLKDYMSDLLGSSSYDGIKNDIIHNFRFNIDQGKIKSQSLSYNNISRLGISNIEYTQERVENNSILENGSEVLIISYASNKFYDYSTLSFNTSFDLIKDDPTKYNIGYKYFDECFGVTIDFERSFYEDRDLKPKDLLTLMLSFKYLGSYKSSNLAVSEIDKQDIRWISEKIDSNTFE